MTDVNTRKFYQFLAGFQQEGKNWVNVADSNYGNGDGTVIKSEFRKFMNAEWNGEENGELTNDLINSFWKKIDTNTSASKISGTKLKNLNALDKTEVANLDKQLEVYVAFDEFIANNVKIPNVLNSTGSQWKADVTEKLSVLLEQYISGRASGDLNTILDEAYPQIANTCTAQYCAVEYQTSLLSSVLKDYPDYKVADDSTLQVLIATYISSIDADTDSVAIKEEIMSIMDAYLATAGLGEDSGYDLSSLGFNKNTINGLQKEVIIQTIKNALIEDSKNYEGYEDEFKTAVQQFIESKLAQGGTFEELKVCANEFATSEYKKNLDNVITIDKTYKNVDEKGNFYKALVIKFGESIAKLISQNSRYIDVYKEILNDVKTKVQNGSLTMDNVSDYIIEQISNRLAEFFPSGYGDMSLSELATLYDKMAKAADVQTDDEKSLTQHREAAINYCDSVAGKSASLKTAVIDIFGTNWSSVINSLYPSEIKSKMAELKAKVSELGDVNDFEVSSWNDLPKDVTTSLGKSKNYKLNATINNGTNTIDSNRITYSAVVKSGSGTATVNNLNTLVITGSKENGYTRVEVTVLVDGVKVGTQTINVKTVSDSFDWSSMTQKYNGYIADGSNDTPLATQSLGELYNGNGVINLLPYSDMNGNQNWKDSVATGKATLENFVSGTLVQAVKATGNYDETALNTAANKVIALYNVAFDQSIDGSHWAGKKSTKTNEVSYDGETYSYQVSKYYKSSTAHNTSYSSECSASNNQLGLRINESYRDNMFQITVNIKCVMDLFNKFYQQALGV